MKTRLILCIVALFFFSLNSNSQVVATFTGGGSDNLFTNPDNWQGGSVPADGADIIISPGVIMEINTNYICNSLTINEDASFFCNGATLEILEAVYDKDGNPAINISSSMIISSSIWVDEPSFGTFTDSRDDTEYGWVRIGSQVWMAENLAYLPSVSPKSAGSVDNPYYYVYGYNGYVVSEAKAMANYTTYGVLYNWRAAMNGDNQTNSNPSGKQGICPDGWHLPSSSEWLELIDFIANDGHSGTEGTALKSTNLWYMDWDRTDDYGFAGLPGGERFGVPGSADFYGLTEGGYFWTTTRVPSSLFAYCYYLYYDRSDVTEFSDNNAISAGYSVRCVKDLQ